MSKRMLIEVSDIKIPELCPYFNRPLRVRERDWAPSLDRIDNSKGYIKGNIMVVSYKANRMKNDCSLSDLMVFSSNALKLHEEQAP